jgi:hypothetical protein
MNNLESARTWSEKLVTRAFRAPRRIVSVCYATGSAGPELLADGTRLLTARQADGTAAALRKFDRAPIREFKPASWLRA